MCLTLPERETIDEASRTRADERRRGMASRMAGDQCRPPRPVSGLPDLRYALSPKDGHPLLDGTCECCGGPIVEELMLDFIFAKGRGPSEGPPSGSATWPMPMPEMQWAGRGGHPGPPECPYPSPIKVWSEVPMITVAQTLPALNALSDYMLSLSYSSRPIGSQGLPDRTRHAGGLPVHRSRGPRAVHRNLYRVAPDRPRR